MEKWRLYRTREGCQVVVSSEQQLETAIMPEDEQDWKPGGMMNERMEERNQGIPEGVETVLYCTVLGTMEQVVRYKE